MRRGRADITRGRQNTAQQIENRVLNRMICSRFGHAAKNFAMLTKRQAGKQALQRFQMIQQCLTRVGKRGIEHRQPVFGKMPADRRARGNKQLADEQPGVICRRHPDRHGTVLVDPFKIHAKRFVIDAAARVTFPPQHRGKLIQLAHRRADRRIFFPRGGMAEPSIPKSSVSISA